MADVEHTPHSATEAMAYENAKEHEKLFRWMQKEVPRLQTINADLLAACEAVIASPRSRHIAGGYYIQVSLAPDVIAQAEAAIAKAEEIGS